jgi:hypothetical protein
MLQDTRRINKSIIIADSIEARGWSLAMKNNLFLCCDCKSPLFYVRQQWGIVEEGDSYQVYGYKHKFYFALRVVGLALYCAECGEYNEDYDKYFYPKDKMVCTWDDDELGYAEQQDVEFWVDQLNRTENVIPRYTSKQGTYLKSKYDEYMDKNHPELRAKKENGKDTKRSNGKSSEGSKKTSAIQKRPSH